MTRYDTDIRDGTLYLEKEDGWLEIGSLDDICELIGGEHYEIQYDERERTVLWLDTDEEGKLTINVRETLAEMSYEREFVATLEAVDPEVTDDGHSKRAVVFADSMQAIWDRKGDA